MKKLFLVIVLFFSLSFVFGQKKGDGLLKVLNAINDGLNTYNNKNGQPSNKSSNSGYGSQKQISYTLWRSSSCYNFIQYRYGITWKGKQGSKFDDVGGNGGDAYNVQIKNTSNKVIQLTFAVLSNSNQYKNKIETIGGGWSNDEFIINWVTGQDVLINPGETIEGSGILNADDKVVFEIIGVKVLNWNDKSDWGYGRIKNTDENPLNMQFTNCSNGEECPWCEIYENASRESDNEAMVQNWKSNYEKWCKGRSSKQNGNVLKKEVIEKNVEKTASTNNYTSGKELIKNLGEIDNGQTYTHSFRLSKIVKSAVASCGCITVDTNKNLQTVVMANFHGISNYKGPFVKNITVTYEDGTSETLTLKGELK